MGKSLDARRRAEPDRGSQARRSDPLQRPSTVENFTDAYAALDAASASALVGDARRTPKPARRAVFRYVAKARAMARSGVATIEELCGATTRVMQGIEPYLLHIAMEGAR